MTQSSMNPPNAVAKHTAGNLFRFPFYANRPDRLRLVPERIYRLQTGAARSGKAALFCQEISQPACEGKKRDKPGPQKLRFRFSAKPAQKISDSFATFFSFMTSFLSRFTLSFKS